MTTDVKLRSADGRRGALVYLAAGTTSTWRIRAEKYPEHGDGGLWFGGRVLWGHDQTSQAAAVEIANRWVEDGELPHD